jgi:hypothetical protein
MTNVARNLLAIVLAHSVSAPVARVGRQVADSRPIGGRRHSGLAPKSARELILAGEPAPLRDGLR